MKFQKFVNYLLVVSMLILFGFVRVQAQTPEVTPVPTPEKTRHHKKAMMMSGAMDVQGEIQALKDRIQALEDNALSSPQAASNAMVANQQAQSDEEGWTGAQGMHNARVSYSDASEYLNSEARYIDFGNTSGNMGFRIGGYMFADAELNFQPSSVYSVAGSNGFLAQKAHLSFDGRYDKMFGMSIGIEGDKSTSVSIGFFHAYAFAEFDPGFKLIMGKYTNPLSLEGLQPSADLPFMEASMVSDLVPNKDIGIMAVGSFSHIMDYALDVANGEQDNESSATGPGKPTENTKSVTARVFFTPWEKSHIDELKGLGFGIAGSWDNEVGGDTAIWSKLETSLGGTSFATYLATPKGDFLHWDPQMYYYLGSFGFQSELVQSIQTVGLSGYSPVQLTNTAWMAEASWVFGGEATFEGPKVDNEFDLSKGTWGAIEVVGRFHQVYLDSNSFYYNQAFSGSSVALASGNQVATAYGLAVNWWFNTHFKTQFDFERTDFSGGNVANINSEQVFYTRMAFIL